MNKEKEEKLAEISARITKMIEYLGETPNSFATKLGYPRAQTIYDIQKKKSAPSFDFFQRFSIAGFSAIINYDWLLTGEGSMLRNEEQTEEKNTFLKAEKKMSQDALKVLALAYKPYNKEGVVWCNLTGHSMEPELSNGDIIALKEVNTPIQYLPSGEIYGIVTDDYRTVKRVRLSHKEGFIRLIPSNKSEEYCEQEIPISMIRKVYAVLGSIRKFF